METCVMCEHWKRDGADGICFGGTPDPKIMEVGKQYVLVWPRTQADQHKCGGFSPVDKKELM